MKIRRDVFDADHGNVVGQVRVERIDHLRRRHDGTRLEMCDLSGRVHAAVGPSGPGQRHVLFEDLFEGFFDLALDGPLFFCDGPSTLLIARGLRLPAVEPGPVVFDR